MNFCIIMETNNIFVFAAKTQQIMDFYSLDSKKSYFQT